MKIATVDCPGRHRPDSAAPIRVARETVGFWEELSVTELAELQSVRPVQSLDDLWGDFWPDGESVDDFIAAVRQWRREDATA